MINNLLQLKARIRLQNIRQISAKKTFERMTNAHTTSDLINAAKKYQQFHQKNSLSEIIANWTLLKSVYESPANEQEIYRLSKEKIHHLNQTDLASINTSYNQLTYQLNKLYMGSLNKTFEDILLVQDLPKGKHNL